MRYFVNTFLLLFLADASVSVFDEFLIQSFEHHSLSLFRQTLAFITFGLAVGAFVFSAFDQRIPKRAAIVPFTYLLACSVLIYPLGALIDQRDLSTAFSIGQLLIALFVFKSIRSRSSNSFLLTASSFDEAPFKLKHTVIFLATSTATCLLVLPFVIYFLTVEIISRSTANFLRMDTQGIYLTEKHYFDGKKTVSLIPMMHIAETNFYDDITDALGTSGAIVLAEGVSDDHDLMLEFRDTTRVAELLGLASQATMKMDGEYIVLDQIRYSANRDTDAAGVKIMRADIDSSELSSQTLDFLNAAGRYLAEHEHMIDVFLSFYRWSNEHMTTAEQDAIYAEILDKRNGVLLQHLAQALLHFDKILIPWGALHMPTFESYLFAHDFSIAGQRERRAISFWSN